MEKLLSNVKKASKDLLKLTEQDKNKCLELISKALIENSEYIIEENKKDIEYAIANNIKKSMIDRLTLTNDRLVAIAKSVLDVAKLDSKIGEVIEAFTGDEGIKINKIRVPFGVIGVIFEARPNVCVDVAVLCLKTSNASVLKGGKECILTNKALVSVMQNAIKDIVNPNVITLIPYTSREVTDELICKKEYIDLLIPRGSKNLIQYIVNNAKIPFIETGAGNCSLYVEKTADLAKSITVAINAKYQRPSVCNAIENIIVDKEVANVFLPVLYEEFNKLNIEMRGDDEVCNIINCNKATYEDFYTEYNDYIVALKIVSNYNEAISFINEHSTHHSETIMTSDEVARDTFFRDIDSACCYYNASTRFTDGGEFGFGAEIGISTDKLHARGPMGLKEITTYKYVIYGDGQVRK